jgi:glycosyltransferase involved in cell wall biosynthesis
MRRLLMIAFHFPPEGGSGTQRSLKFARYLPAWGWDVEVLTVRTAVHDLLDPTLLEELPREVRIHRTICLDAAKSLAWRGKSPNFVSIPDRYVSWLPFGVIKAIQLLRQRHFDAIYSTSPVPTAHLIAWAVARISGLPWVCDFRDPFWSGKTAENLKTATLRRLEKRFMVAASHVLLNTHVMHSDVAARYPELDPSRMSVLPNGYDEADFLEVAPSRRTEPSYLEFLHTGEVYATLRDPKPLLDAFRSVRQCATVPPEVKFRFVGAGPDLDRYGFSEWVQQQGLDKVVSLETHVSHARSIEQLLAADVLLLLQCHPSINRQIPAKAYEYLRAGRPVLAVVPPDSATADLIRSTRAGWTVDSRDRSGLARCLEEILTKHRAGSLGSSIPRGAQFDRRKLAGELAAILEQLVSSRARASQETVCA